MSRVAATALMAAAGALVALQAPINSRLGKGIGTFPAAAFSFAAGLVVLAAIAAVIADPVRSATRLGNVPWWALLGGLLGAVYVTSVLVSVRTLGAGGVTAATIAGQLTMAVLIDRFGLLGVARQPITIARIAGVLLLAGGVALIVRG